MKSIADTLGVIKNAVAVFEKKVGQDAYIALIGGHAVIFYGVERTTLDVDACLYFLSDNPGKSFCLFLKKQLSKRFRIRLLEASKDPSDPLRHDLIVIDDSKGEFPRVDILIARYKWELEALKQSKFVKALDFPVIPAPALVAMKLQAGGRKDDLDVVELLKGLSKKDIGECFKLAKSIGKDKKFSLLLKEARRAS